MFVGLSAHSLAAIGNFQWFSKLPSPLNGMVEGNHWDQWFSNGFGVRQPLVTMIFDGCAPLVRRWNGYVPSSKSMCHLLPYRTITMSTVPLHIATVMLIFLFLCLTAAWRARRPGDEDKVFPKPLQGLGGSPPPHYPPLLPDFI